MIKINQLGDTIVEVLIAIAVLSVVLTGAYAITNRNVNSIRAAQEHTEALKYAEAQLEQLKVRAVEAGNTVFTRSDVFCMNGGEQSAGAPSQTMPLPDLNSPADSAMTYSSGLNGCTFPNGIDYHVAIDRTGGAATWQQVFTVHVRWDSLTGPGHTEVVLMYTMDK